MQLASASNRSLSARRVSAAHSILPCAYGPSGPSWTKLCARGKRSGREWDKSQGQAHGQVFTQKIEATEEDEEEKGMMRTLLPLPERRQHRAPLRPLPLQENKNENVWESVD